MYHDIKELINYIESLRRNEKKISLDYMYKLCEIFSNPEKGVKFIHIGGTNGKGSTVNYVKNILLEAGYNVGTFISPYIVSFNERITYNDKFISDEDILKYANLIISKFAYIDSLGLRQVSFFEFVTLMAFMYFADQKELDFAIIEVGIGGLLDSTSVINPIVSAITSVSYDHMNVLGHSLEEIWTNKLGIVKDKVPLVTIYDKEFKDLISKYCNNKQSPLILMNKEDIKDAKTSLEGTSFSYKDYYGLQLSMLGHHQIENAALAINIINVLQEQYFISKENIYKGLHKAKWIARLELISKKPLVILDGAHNYDAIKRLGEFILELKNDKNIRLVFAVSSNKEKDHMIKLIENYADEIIFTHFSYKRSDEAINLFNLSSHKNKKIIDDIDEIIDLIFKDFESINIFCGSLYFVSEVRSLLMQKI